MCLKVGQKTSEKLSRTKEGYLCELKKSHSNTYVCCRKAVIISEIGENSCLILTTCTLGLNLVHD